jgi:FkbM family methyltransferase
MTRSTRSRVADLCRGFAANLRFSNWPEIVWHRFVRRRATVLCFEWHGRVRIVCNCARNDHVAVQEIFARDVYEPLFVHCRFPGGRIRYVNVGAHIGAFDLWLRERGLTIVQGLAMELNPETCRRCEHNLSSNGLTGVRVFNNGVAGQDGFVDFVPSGDSLGDNIFTPASRAGAGVEPARRVELLTLATLLHRHAGLGEQFDLLKLDCEGAEYGILRTAPLAELRRFRCVVAEFHPEPAGESVDAAYQRLREAGFASRRGGPGPFRFMDFFVRAPGD